MKKITRAKMLVSPSCPFRQMLKAKKISPELFEAILILFNYSWNTNADIKHCAVADLGFYRHHAIDRICMLASGRVTDRPLCPSFRRTISDDEVAAIGVDLSRVSSGLAGHRLS